MTTEKKIIREVAVRVRAIVYEDGNFCYQVEPQGDPGPHEVSGIASYLELVARRAMISAQDEARSVADAGPSS